MFQRVLVKEETGPGKRRSMAASAVAHVVVVGVGVMASLLALHAVGDPMRADLTLNFFAPPAPPDIDPPKPKQKFELEPQRPQPEPAAEPEAPKPAEPKRVEFRAPELPEPEVNLPRQRDENRRLELAADRLNMLDARVDAPEPAVGRAGRTEARTASRLVSGGGSPALAATMDAPEVKVPGGGRGGPGLPARAPGLVVGDGGGGGSIVAYGSSSPATMADMTVPRPGGPGRRGGKPGGAAPGLITVAGDGTGGGAGTGGRGIKYDGAADAPGGAIGGFGMSGRPGGRGGSGGGTRIDGVRTRLAGKYGLPLVSVNDLGQRSTDAARWNMLLPQISDLLRDVLAQGSRAGSGNVASVERDGSNLIIRYRDGIVHVLVPTDDGLAALFVARGGGARPVVSKIQEAECALGALSRLSRGVS